MAAKCCIVGCPFKSAGIPLLPFPKRDAPNYKLWVSAMHRSDTQIHQLENPFVCAMHFEDQNVHLTGKAFEYHYPFKYLSRKEISFTVRGISSINNFVADWLHRLRKANPDVVVDDDALKAKAKEVASIVKLVHVVDCGWIDSFEEYALKHGIKPWKVVSMENVKPKVVTNDKPAMDFESITSIDTYQQALEIVALLDEYARRTDNNDAIELITHMQKIITENIK